MPCVKACMMQHIVHSTENGTLLERIHSNDEQHADFSRLSIADGTAELLGDTNEERFEGEDADSEDNSGEGKGENEGKKRDKNRRAQQRFRQRQKAKLHMREQETLQLQRQVQELQAQLVSLQLEGMSGGLSQQLQRMSARCHDLQAENKSIRALALRYMEENTLLRAERERWSVDPVSVPVLAKETDSLARQSMLMQRLAHLQVPSPLLAAFPPITKHLREPPVAQRASGQRGAVFCNLSTIPWKIASASSEPGVPVGISPGGTGASILTKLLNRVPDGSTTMLVQLPPGFEHDYLIQADRQVEEGLILSGSLTDTVLNKTYLPGDYCQVHPGCPHGPYLADTREGCLVFVITRVNMKTIAQSGDYQSGFR